MVLPELSTSVPVPQQEFSELSQTDSGTSDLPLNDPFPEYVSCPHCGELEVEVWCYQKRVQCHNCGQWFEHQPPPCHGSSPICAKGES